MTEMHSTVTSFVTLLQEWPEGISTNIYI